jgi:hypothetical protein
MSAWFGEDAKRNADHGFLAGSSLTLTIKFPIYRGLVLPATGNQIVRPLEPLWSLRFHFPIVICVRPDN